LKSILAKSLLLICLALSAFSAFAQTLTDQEPKLKLREVYRIKVWDLPGGTIEVSSDQGKNYTTVGTVIYPTQRTNAANYKASRWVPDGQVAASAVNAIHIKTATSSADGGGVVFSLLPSEMQQKPKYYKSYFSPDSSIYTDIKAGEAIFGGGLAPFVGDRVLVSRAGYALSPLPTGYIPVLGDRIYIIVERPVDLPKEIVFENRFGGAITAKYFGVPDQQIGEVLRPVAGVGRFEGTKYASVGRIRANHPGVIDVSTSPLGKIGGFQIVPSLHASEMKGVRELTQWMVIGSPPNQIASIEGQAPFFRYFVHPAYSAGDLADDNWQDKLLDHFLVEVKYQGDDKWQPMPSFYFNDYDLSGEIPDWAGSALSNISYFRILFPID
jgi:hypothetical protein